MTVPPPPSLTNHECNLPTLLCTNLCNLPSCNPLHSLDGQWYRAYVERVNRSEPQYDVFFIDYGNKERVPSDKVGKAGGRGGAQGKCRGSGLPKQTNSSQTRGVWAGWHRVKRLGKGAGRPTRRVRRPCRSALLPTHGSAPPLILCFVPPLLSPFLPLPPTQVRSIDAALSAVPPQATACCLAHVKVCVCAGGRGRCVGGVLNTSPTKANQAKVAEHRQRRCVGGGGGGEVRGLVEQEGRWWCGVLDCAAHELPSYRHLQTDASWLDTYLPLVSTVLTTPPSMPALPIPPSPPSPPCLPLTHVPMYTMRLCLPTTSLLNLS